MKKRNVKKVILVAILVASLITTVVAMGQSWGDRNSEGIKESLTTALYNPARYAFDGDESTFWAVETDNNSGWAEKYWEIPYEIKGAEIQAKLAEGSSLRFSYEKDGTWIAIENGIIEGPLDGTTKVIFTEENRKTKKVLVKLESAEPETDCVYEINLDKQEKNSKWGKIEPESYSFNQEEYINLSPSRLWNGYIKETWFEPIWYVQYEIQQTRDYKHGIFAPYNGNPAKNGEIIWELDGKYKIDLIKAYFEAGWRNIAFDFWDGENWVDRREFKNSNATGWNRLEIDDVIETERIRISFPSGWENARFINQIEIWGEGERKNTTEDILFVETAEKNEYEATISDVKGSFEIEFITKRGTIEELVLEINENEYILEKPYFSSDKEFVYKQKINAEDIRNGLQHITVQTKDKELSSILIRKNRQTGKIELNNEYSDGYTEEDNALSEVDYEKTIKLDRKYEVEKIIVYAKEANTLKVYIDNEYKFFEEEGEGKWSLDMDGQLSDEIILVSDREFILEEIEIFGSPVEDKGASIEIWSTKDNVDSKSCIVGWKGSRESQVLIDGYIHPRQEGNLFWMPVKEVGKEYLEKENHIVKCTEGNIYSEKKYKVNPSDDTQSLLEKIKKNPLLLTIDIPYGNILTQTREIEISGRYGNGEKVRVYVNGEETETNNGKYKSLISLTEGTNRIVVKAEDITGRVAEKEVEVYFDSTNPIIEIMSPTEGEYINTGKAEFGVDGKEDSELWWQFNDEEWERGYGKIKYKDYFLDDGFYTYTVKAQDRAGNISEEKVVNFCMDETAPLSFNIRLNVDGWTNNNAPIAEFETTDATSGISHYEYKVDENGWKDCESPLQIETLEDGKRIIFVRAIDKAGNIREEKTEAFIDTSLPPMPVNARPVSSEKSIKVKWEGLDDNSIVNGNRVAKEGNRSYRIERSPEWDSGIKTLKDYGYGKLEYEDVETVKGESYSYRIWAVDRAGNESEKTDWKSAIVGLAVTEVEKDSETIVEYDGMTVTLPKGSLAEDIVKVQIHKISENDIEETPLNVQVGSSFMVTTVRKNANGEYITEHADLKEPAWVEITYNPTKIPMDYEKNDIAAFYYDDIWGTWMRLSDSYIDEGNKNVIFKTEHFSQFNVQATKKVVLSEAELREGAYKLKSEKIGPSEVRVSGEDGGVSTEFTEYVMPGKGDMQLPIQRVYSTGKAYSDAADRENKEKMKIDGESVWEIADGWKINMPYMMVNGDSVVLFGTEGNCFNIGQMNIVPGGEGEFDNKDNSFDNKDNSEVNYHILMESHEYNDTRVDLFFYQYQYYSSKKYRFEGAVLHQGDGKKVHYNKDGKVSHIEDCTGNNKITFDYEENNIKITDTLGNLITLKKEKGLINKIETGEGSVIYEIKDHKLAKATDIGGREWQYDYTNLELETESKLLDSSNSNQEKPKKYTINALSSISGLGYGYTQLSYEIEKDFTYEDTVKSAGKEYTYEIKVDKFYAKKKKEGLTQEKILRETIYSFEVEGPEEKQFYVSKSMADDGNTKTETVYEKVVKSRFRLSNAPEAIRDNWEEKSTGEQEKDNKQVLTYAKEIKTYGPTLIQSVKNEIDEDLMRMTKVMTTKGENNFVIDEYEYFTKYKEGSTTEKESYNGNLVKEKHTYTTGDRTSTLKINRKYSDSINNRTNLVVEMEKISSGNIEKGSSTVKESYGYNSYGQLISKKNSENEKEWKYTYYSTGDSNGLLESVTSPEERITRYEYKFDGDGIYTITTTKGKEPETIKTVEEFDKANGNLLKTIDADSHVVEYEYDKLGRLTKQTKNEGKFESSVIYDDKNLTTTVTDELKTKTINYFDNLGRLIKVEKEKSEKKKEEKTISIDLVYDEYDRVVKMSIPYYDNGETTKEIPYTSFSYDTQGRVLSTTDADNLQTTYTYYDSMNMVQINKGNLEKIKEYKDNLGNVIKTEKWIKENEWTSKETWYDGEGKEVCSKDENGNKTRILYNELGLVSSITYPNELREERSYDKDGILEGIEKKQGDKVLYKELYELDGLGRITEKRIPTGENSKVVLEKYTYDNRGNVTEESLSYEGDATDVRTITKEYDYESRIISQTDGEGETTKKSYDAKGNLLTVEDPRQNVASYMGEFYMQMEYDAFGRVVKGWTPHTVKRATLTDANVDVVIEYDAMGNVITRTDKADDSSSVITKYTYSKAGRLQEEQTDGYTIKYKYDNAGRQTEITAPDGVKTYKKYDGSGRLIEEQTGNTNAKTKYVYNPNGTLKAKIDRKGNKTEYEYDCMNQLTKESVSGLLEKTYTYDSLGRKVSENDKERNLREYNYDNLGRIIKEITPEGIKLSYSYDARGNVTEYIDGRKTKFVREYTKTDLLSSEKAFAVKEDNTYGKTETALRSYVYDEGGLLEEITEGSSSIFYNEKDGSYQSDAYGNIRSMKWSSTGFEMNYEYDNLNRMTNVKTPDGKDVVYAYNQNNQVTKFGDVSITYSKSRISEYTLLNGIKKSFEYNDLGLTSSLKYNKNKDEINISTGFSYTYDDNFNIKTRTSLDTKKLSSFDYDQANRLTNSYMEGEFESKTAEQLTTSNFSYINRDLVGTKQELVKYEDLPEIIFDTSARSYVYKFSGTKEIRAIELYPKSKVHRVRERDVHIYVKQSSEDAWVEVRNWKFNKDEKNGKLSFVFKEAVRAGYVKVRSVWDDRDKENKSIDDYSTFKGNANNLLRIWTLENTLAEEYSYDGNSNRIRKAENGSGFSYEYYKNKQGGNTAKVKYDGKWYYTYDANGNRTSRAKALISGVADKNKEYWTYEWDLWNRLVKVVQYNAPDNGECVEVSYEYDALNHRIKRTSYDENNKEREVTKYAYGRNGALAYQEKTKDGSVTKRSFTYLNNEIIGFTDCENNEETAYYTVTDIQGSITEVYDGSSKLVWKSGYTAFGELAGEVVDLIDFDGMYTGCDYDAETGLTYHWNRWRSEDGSAFISEDPARDGMNWYGYAGCNPIVYVDPTGLAAYGPDGQQYSTLKNKTQESENKTEQPQNIIGQGPTGVPTDVSPIPTNVNLLKLQVSTPRKIITELIVTNLINLSTFIDNIKEKYTIPSKSEHYARNNLNVDIGNDWASANRLAEQGKAIRMTEGKDSYHEQGTAMNYDPGMNDKFVSLDGKYESVYNRETGQKITDPVNQGTLNRADPNSDFIGHFFQDMVPYYMWGNSEGDPTNVWERITGTYQGNVNASKQEAAQFRAQRNEENKNKSMERYYEHH